MAEFTVYTSLFFEEEIINFSQLIDLSLTISRHKDKILDSLLEQTLYLLGTLYD